MRTPYVRSQGAALLHLHRELAQHLGQIEAYRDVMIQSWARLVP